MVTLGLGAAWLPVESPPPFEFEEASLELGDRDLLVGHRAFEDWRSVIDPYNQLRGLVTTESEHLQVTLDPDTPVVAPWPNRETPTLPIERESLVGLSIVLDPGHFGGAWSEHESRHIERDGEFPIREGNLNYATAALTADALTRAGARVFLTRGAPPTRPFEEHIPPRHILEREASIWLGNNAHRWDTRFLINAYPAWFADRLLRMRRDAKIRDSAAHLFAIGDLRERSRLGRDCAADAMISIHYNGAKRPSVNHILAFIPGHFMKGELLSPAAKRLAIDALMSGRLPVSAQLGLHIVDAMKEEMGLETSIETKRSHSQVLPDYPGVFARNLAILRRTRVPVVLVEGPFMSHPAEYPRLVNAEDGTPGIRTRQYARALVRGITDAAPILRAHRKERPLSSGGCPLLPWAKENKRRVP